MDKNMLSFSEIDLIKNDKIKWHKYIRKKECETIFESIGKKYFDRALELGAGDGTQSEIISKYCRRLVCTDKVEYSQNWIDESFLNKKISNVDYRICNAENLSSFKNEYFELVYSSNMLEHVENLKKCIEECIRVLKKDGTMIHIMPNRFWKFFYFTLALIKFRKPKIHGANNNHINEFIKFGKKNWINTFKSNNLKIVKIINLPFYVGHGNKFIPIIKIGNYFNIHASHAYILQKKHENQHQFT